MPRLSPSLFRSAYHIDPLLPQLLRECRDLASARNELRWLRERAIQNAKNHRGHTHATNASLDGWRGQLKHMLHERARGKPLQYILGDQPFGELEILCRKRVLIPRPETESYTFRTAELILSRLRREQSSSSSSQNRAIRILDLCTGTGCIPLLLHSLLAREIPNITIIGVDISPDALFLARDNLEHNIAKGHLQPRARHDVQFLQADMLGGLGAISRSALSAAEGSGASDSTISSIDAVLETVSPFEGGQWDVLISNPPYISPVDFGNGTTSRSVRRSEPKLALVPPPTQDGNISKPLVQDMYARADSFYPRLLALSERTGAWLTVLECGDIRQARRVARIAKTYSKEGCRRSSIEIWRCDGSEGKDNVDETECGGVDDGGARAVVIERNTT